VIRVGARVFVDTGAWVALAVVRDPLHERAREQWERLDRAGARLFTSLPVVLETFTFLDRKGSRELALAWRRGLEEVPRLEILECGLADLRDSWPFLSRREFHKLGLVDATSFVLMRRHRIRTALAFDAHFAVAGFHYVA
jgi:predicted nucleic acid-binding protein